MAACNCTGPAPGHAVCPCRELGVGLYQNEIRRLRRILNGLATPDPIEVTADHAAPLEPWEVTRAYCG